MHTPNNNPALTAARKLADDGEHIHYVAFGEACCLNRICDDTPDR